jgi:hypothetical protein
MHLAGISLELLTRTVNDRHHGLVNDSLNRVLAVHWLNSESAIFVDSIVTKYTEEPTDDPDQNRIKIWQVAPQLAIRLSNVLPAGSLSPESPISELLPIVAESFGLKVSCHPDEDAACATTSRLSRPREDRLMRKRWETLPITEMKLSKSGSGR